MNTQKMIGLARVVDYDEKRQTCRVRLCGEDGLPNGAVLAGVPYLATATPMKVSVPKRSEEELNTMARQNLLYNSHQPIVIE